MADSINDLEARIKALEDWRDGFVYTGTGLVARRKEGVPPEDREQLTERKVLVAPPNPESIWVPEVLGMHAMPGGTVLIVRHGGRGEITLGQRVWARGAEWVVSGWDDHLTAGSPYDGEAIALRVIEAPTADGVSRVERALAALVFDEGPEIPRQAAFISADKADAHDAERLEELKKRYEADRVWRVPELK